MAQRPAGRFRGPARLWSNVRLVFRLGRLESERHPGARHPSMWRRGFLSDKLYLYPGIEDRSLPYVSDVKVQTRVGGLNSKSARSLLEDKSVFADALAARGLQAWAPDVYGTIVSGSLRPRSAAALERLREQTSVIVKPISGAGGRGVQLVSSGEAERVPRGLQGDDLLVQERLLQHPVLEAINPGSLNTMRVLVMRLPEDGPVIVAATHRWGTAATGAVDNVSSGGLCSSIDLDTGELGPAVGAPRKRRRVQLDRHPDTGVQITGLRVPCWPEVHQLALSLMDAFTELDHVGWDLCVTDRGPRIVEGNANRPNLSILQFHGPIVQDPRVRAVYVQRGLLPA